VNKTELIQFLRANEIWAKRTMGQNFLVDNDVLGKIIEAADIKPSDTILEIGPGLGTLTAELLKRAGEIVTIERDDKLAGLLNCSIAQLLSDRGSNSTIQQFNNEKLRVINDDALKVNIEELIGDKPYKVVANIPYNITSPIIRKFLETEHKPELMVLMVQKEVAERIVAKPGDMSLLSISVQFYAEAEIVDLVKAESFFPVPKVDSAIIKLTAKSQKLAADEKSYFRLVKFGFAARRKTLENNLAAGLHIEKSIAADIIRKTGLDAKIRAEDLSVANWLSLYKVIKEGNDGEGTRRSSQKN